MKATYRIDRLHRRDVPRGGRLGQAQARLAAAEKAFEPLDREQRRLCGERDRILARIVALTDAATARELRKLEDLQLERTAIERQLRNHSGVGTPYALAAAEHAESTRELAWAKADQDRVRQKIAAQVEQLGQLLYEAHSVSGSPADLVMSLEVRS